MKFARVWAMPNHETFSIKPIGKFVKSYLSKLEVTAPGGIVLSFGWNSVGMGLNRGYELIEILLCCHGGAHYEAEIMKNLTEVEL